MDTLKKARSGPKPSTSREEIVDRAIGLMQEHGPEGLSFRALGKELGIAGPAIYRYFKNMADLEDEAASRIMSGWRPLKPGKKAGMRDQLVRLGMEMLEVHRTHPYLLQIRGPATVVMLAGHARQSLEALTVSGIDFHRAFASYSLVANLAFSWGVQSPAHSNDAAKYQASYMQELGPVAPQILKLASKTANPYRQMLEFYIDQLLAD